ncbi:twin-arginine translocase subunit TatC [Rhabdobacter roseus]|uniref:Sec-independent protein translocase protein TatC n=1 Tax=Rhabdobacter roseus TaxID=1655419 RepID=A0A840TR83_9BACT|nr:twin-arginine translocase subunit TatC [Rhabdobacter roseus]MBB5282498.1 sec-independent protein translocase protein TatC [Rhabdobacter roseus]
MSLDQDFEKESEEEGQEMTFLQHLEELRWHVIRAVGSILVFAIIAYIYVKDIYRLVIIAPGDPSFWTYRMMCKLGDAVGAEGLCIKALNFKIQVFGVGEQFTMGLTTAIITGLIFAFPYAFWEIWRFVKPGLRPSERRAARGAVFYVTFLFFSGVFFGYYIVTPLALNFLANYQLDESIINEFSLASYISLVATLTLACGIAFQLPIVVFVLSRVGILTPSFMREYRRHSWIVILIVAAIITPSPDIYSQILVALPLMFLYEVSIVVSGRVEKAKLAEEKALRDSGNSFS